jgi:hypothetical protein
MPRGNGEEMTLDYGDRSKMMAGRKGRKLGQDPEDNRR